MNKKMEMSCLLVSNKVYKTNNEFNNLYLILKLIFVIKCHIGSQQTYKETIKDSKLDLNRSAVC